MNNNTIKRLALLLAALALIAYTFTSCRKTDYVCDCVDDIYNDTLSYEFKHYSFDKVITPEDRCGEEFYNNNLYSDSTNYECNLR